MPAYLVICDRPEGGAIMGKATHWTQVEATLKKHADGCWRNRRTSGCGPAAPTGTLVCNTHPKLIPITSLLCHYTQHTYASSGMLAE